MSDFMFFPAVGLPPVHRDLFLRATAKAESRERMQGESGYDRKGRALQLPGRLTFARENKTGVESMVGVIRPNDTTGIQEC